MLEALARPLTLAALLAPSTVGAQIGVGSPVQSVQLSAVKAAFVSVSLPTGSVATLPVPVVTSWSLDPAHTASVTLVAYFGVPARALAGGSAAIPSTRIYGRVSSGGAQSFIGLAHSPLMTGIGAVGTGGGTLVLFRQPINSAHGTGSRTDDLQLRLDLTGSPGLPAGSYSGTLDLVAITQ